MLAEAVDGELPATLELLRLLVEEPSVEGNDAAIRRCVDLVHDAVAPLASEVERPEHDGLPALVARFGSQCSSRCVTFAGHVDVVPADGAWPSSPFALTQRGGRVHGRGVCDMKGGVAAFVGAIRALAASGQLDECAIELVITGDEEVGSRRGMQALLAAHQVRGRMAVCGEPTSLDVYLGNRGVAWYEIVVRGKGGHAGQAHALSSPIPPAVDLCQAIAHMDMELSSVDERFDPPRPNVAVTRIDAGAATNAVNVVPDAVTLGVDRRLLPAEDIDVASEELRQLVERAVRAPYRHEFRVLRRWPPCETSPDHVVSRAAVAAARAVGRSGRFGMDLAANDSSFLVDHGIPALLLGPGAPEEAHVTGEGLDLDEFADAIAVYAELALACARLEP